MRSGGERSPKLPEFFGRVVLPSAVKSESSHCLDTRGSGSAELGAKGSFHPSTAVHLIRCMLGNRELWSSCAQREPGVRVSRKELAGAR